MRANTEIVRSKVLCKLCELDFYELSYAAESHCPYCNTELWSPGGEEKTKTLERHCVAVIVDHITGEIHTEIEELDEDE